MACTAPAAHFFKGMPFPCIVKERQCQKPIKKIRKEKAPPANSCTRGTQYPIGQRGKKDREHQHVQALIDKKRIAPSQSQCHHKPIKAFPCKGETLFMKIKAACQSKHPCKQRYGHSQKSIVAWNKTAYTNIGREQRHYRQKFFVNRRLLRFLTFQINCILFHCKSSCAEAACTL